MSYFSQLIYLHILLMVFWVGADVGVFTSALRYIDPRLSIIERKGCMSLGGVVDRYPRVCFVAILPLGVTLSTLMGFLPLSSGELWGVWALSAVWMLTVIRIMMLLGTPRAKPWQVLERVFLIAYMTVFVGMGIAGLTGHMQLPDWLAGKFICYGAICFFGLALDHSFPAVVNAFTDIEAQGSTPAREALLRGRMWHSLSWVLAIYAGVLAAGYLGTVKP